MRDDGMAATPQQLSSPLEQLLMALIDSGQVRLIINHGGATVEIYGEAYFLSNEQWLMLNVGNAPNCLYVRRGILAHAEFLDLWGTDKAVCFFDIDGRLVLTCALPGTAEESSDFSLVRHTMFARLEASSRGAAWRR